MQSFWQISDIGTLRGLLLVIKFRFIKTAFAGFHGLTIELSKELDRVW